MTTIAPMPLTRVRHDLCQKWRGYLLDGSAVEVTTPILHAHPDVAPLHQFTTVNPASGELAYLRIAPTEHLKRLLALGEERVFEFSTNFRDDLPDETHLPEFTSLEIMARGATCAEMEQVAVDLCTLAVEIAQRTEAALPLWVRHWGERPVVRIELADELRESYGVEPSCVAQQTTVRRVLGDLVRQPQSVISLGVS